MHLVGKVYLIDYSSASNIFQTVLVFMLYSNWSQNLFPKFDFMKKLDQKHNFFSNLSKLSQNPAFPFVGQIVDYKILFLPFNQMFYGKN
jgi:hypothetical protein